MGNTLQYIFHDEYLVEIDATKCHFSHTITYSECLTKNRNGKTEYSKQALKLTAFRPN